MIGSHLVDALLERGAEAITVIDDLSRGRNPDPTIGPTYTLDLRGDIQIPDLVRLFKGAVVFHLAARVTNIREKRGDHLGMLQDNLQINTNVIEAARRGKPKLFEATSTVCVYPHNTTIPTAEAEAWPIQPEDTNEGYGLAKAILEKQAEYLHRECGVPTLVPRFANALAPVITTTGRAATSCRRSFAKPLNMTRSSSGAQASRRGP